jgi:hypothetical protein
MIAVILLAVVWEAFVMGWRHFFVRFDGRIVEAGGECGQECAVGGAGVDKLADS